MVILRGSHPKQVAPNLRTIGALRAAPFLSMKKTEVWETSVGVGDYAHQLAMSQDGPCMASVGDVTNTAPHINETHSKAQTRLPARDPSPRPFKYPEPIPSVNNVRACANSDTR